MRLARGQLKKAKIQEQEDGGGKHRIKSVVYILQNDKYALRKNFKKELDAMISLFLCSTLFQNLTEFIKSSLLFVTLQYVATFKTDMKAIAPLYCIICSCNMRISFCGG